MIIGPNTPRPNVGVSAMLTHRNHILTGIRKGSHAAGVRAFPGGHQELWETWAETAINETEQETGLKVHPIPRHDAEPYLFVTDTRFPERNKQYTTVWIPCFLVENTDIDLTKTIEPLEPDKCEGWNWYTLDHLIQDLLGKKDYTFDDIENQNAEQSAWLPIKQLLRYHHVLCLEYPPRLYEHGATGRRSKNESCGKG